MPEPSKPKPTNESEPKSPKLSPEEMRHDLREVREHLKAEKALMDFHKLKEKPTKVP